MLFLFIRLVMAAVWITCAYKWGDWKNWRKYYPTMLFFGFGDLIYHLIFKNKHLWIFNSPVIAPAITELFVIFTIFFSTTLLYLTHFPKGFIKQIEYVALWVAIYIGIEILATSIGMQTNTHGWTIWWSLFHNVIQFPLLRLHYKRPIFAWIGAFIYLAIIMAVFKVPVIMH